MRLIQQFSLMLMVGALLWGPLSHAISRIGNGKIADSGLGFESDIPSPYFEVNSLADSSVRLKAPPKLTVDAGIPKLLSPYIDVHSLIAEYPSLPSDGTRESVHRYFSDFGSIWKEVVHPNACVVTFMAENETNTTAVAAWGAGKGIVLVADKGLDARNSMLLMIHTLKVTQQGCSWK